jgi:hypothetical protein
MSREAVHFLDANLLVQGVLPIGSIGAKAKFRSEKVKVSIVSQIWAGYILECFIGPVKKEMKKVVDISMPELMTVGGVENVRVGRAISCRTPEADVPNEPGCTYVGVRLAMSPHVHDDRLVVVSLRHDVSPNVFCLSGATSST